VRRVEADCEIANVSAGGARDPSISPKAEYFQ
jgi:hypothetical protein